MDRSAITCVSKSHQKSHRSAVQVLSRFQLPGILAALEIRNRSIPSRTNPSVKELLKNGRFILAAGVRQFGRLFRVRFSCESRDIPKCLSALAGFSHHSDSGQRTLEEIRHAVQGDVWAQFTLALCSGEHMDQRLTLCPPSLLDNSSHVSVPVVELAESIHSHPTFSAGQVISFGEANECISQGGESRARLFQFDIDGANTLSDVPLQRFQEQLPLVAKGVIHALSADIHDAHQFIGGRGGKALLTKKAYGFSKCLILIELLLSSHSPPSG